MANETSGDAGGAVGVTGADGADSGPLPSAFMACTVKVYVVPLDSPLTAAPVAVAAAVALMPAGTPPTRVVTV